MPIQKEQCEVKKEISLPNRKKREEKEASSSTDGIWIEVRLNGQQSKRMDEKILQHLNEYTVRSVSMYVYVSFAFLWTHFL